MTAREVLATFLPEHERDWHSIANHLYSGGAIVIECSCGKPYVITKSVAVNHGLTWEDVTGGLKNAPKGIA